MPAAVHLHPRTLAKDGDIVLGASGGKVCPLTADLHKVVPAQYVA